MEETPSRGPAELKLHLKDPFRSLESLPDVTLPPFTILTGVNGVGKTHLLLAIDSGAVEVVDVKPQETLYFDWTTMFRLKSREVERKDVRAKQQWLRDCVAGARRTFEPRLRVLLHKIGVDVNGQNPWSILRAQDKIRKHEHILAFLSSPMEHAAQTFGEPVEWFNATANLQFKYGWDMLLLLDDREYEQLAAAYPIGARNLQVDDLGRVMMSYFELQTSNRLCRLDEEDGRKPEFAALSDEEFIELFGPPPWHVLTEVMKKLGLDFEIHGPRNFSSAAYSPRVEKRSTGAEINLEHLSSGEKMLMALALSTYASTTRGMREANAIKLVLLDEIDAPLHPSMTRVMMDIIHETLIERLGCSVILATHSPTTVALAPDESVHVMRAGQPGVFPESRERAVRLLADAIPTLSLDVSGRRQIFVESKQDEARYEELYQIFKSRLDATFSLSFIGCGVTTDKGDKVAGCQVVSQMVSALRKHGNTSVWGLIDWDSRNDGSDYVRVLARGRRYAIENCLLDPLLVSALVIDTGDPKCLKKLGLEARVPIARLLREDENELRQQLVRRVEAAVLDSDETGAQTESLYLAGFSVPVNSSVLEMRGHDLSKAVLKEFPCLRRHGGESKLLRRAIQLLQDNEGLLPMDVLDAFSELLATG